MKKLLVLAVFLAVPAFAAEHEELLAAPREFARAFNAHEAEMPKNTFTDDCAILDEFAPFVWSGPGSAKEWYSALMGKTPEQRKKVALFDEHLDIGDAKEVRVKGDAAYLVIPGTLGYTFDGKRHVQTAKWVVTEVKRDGRWIIASHAWAILDETVKE